MLQQKFTLKQLIALNVHLGSLCSSMHHNVGQYIVGRYSGIMLLNLNLTLLYLRRSLNLIDQIILSEGKFLLVSSNLNFYSLLKTRMSTIKNYSYSLGWVGGFLTNFKEIRHYFVRKTRYHENTNRTALSFSKFANIETLTRMPVAIFSLGFRYNTWVQQEALCLNIPLISLVDSDVNPLGLTYSIPGNDDSTGFLYFLILMLSSTALVSHCSKSIKFRLKVLSKVKGLSFIS